MRHTLRCTDCGRPTVIEVRHRTAKGAVIKGLCTTCRRIAEEYAAAVGRQEAVKRTQREDRSE